MADLLTSAQGAMKNAHAPYSDFQVGAAVETADGEIFVGCNVENASYGGTVCAERVAIFSAVAAGHKKFKRLLLISKNPEGVTPCGFCRQVMAEFFTASTEITCVGADGGKSKTYKFSELFPHGFTDKDL